MIATFQFNKDQWTSKSFEIHKAIEALCGPVSFSCMGQTETTWNVQFMSTDDTDSKCTSLDTLQYFSEIKLGTEETGIEIVPVKYIFTEENYEPQMD